MIDVVNNVKDRMRVMVFELVIIIGIIVSFYVFIGGRDFVFQGINIKMPWYVFPLFLSSPLIIFLVVDVYYVIVQAGLKLFSFKLKGRYVDMNEGVIFQKIDEDKKVSIVADKSVLDNNENARSILQTSNQTIGQVVVNESQGQDVKENVQDNKNVTIEQHIKSEIHENDAIKNIESQVSLLQNELKAFKDSTAQSIQEIKDAIVNLRSTISEIDNPFNFMKKYAEVFGIEALERLDQSKIMPSSQIGEYSSESVQVTGGKKVIVTVNSESEKSSSNKIVRNDDKKSFHDSSINALSNKNEQQESGTPISALSIEPERIIHIIIWVNRVSSLFGKDYTSTLLDFYHSVGLIDDKIYNAMVKASELIDKSRKANLNISIKDYIIVMIELMKVLGLDKQHSSFVNIIELLMKDNSLGGFE